MHEALIASKLLYALEATPIPAPMYDRIDASYYKGLRQILNFKTTFGQQQEGSEKNQYERSIHRTYQQRTDKNKERQGIRDNKHKNKRQSNQAIGKDNQEE